MTIERWERTTEVPLLVAALLFLAAYAVPILQPGLGRGERWMWMLVTLATWVVFLVDYVVRLHLAPDSWAYARKNLLDVLVLLLPLLRPLKLVRTLRTFSFLHGRQRLGLEGRAMVYAGSATVLLGLTASLAVLSVERGAHGSNIATFGDAVWWACVTVTGTGYGDLFPVTARGRAIGIGLMFGGLGLLGVVTASFASWFMTRFKRGDEG
ncbi:two pore domain potassium channel family protein [Actinomadura barringtoniae]|uniref:Two pore domain potassium channel family protein n=1 Tax=Actinomadura barringtoniae TaxID=1427535 RepID=A0A939PM31_9ACTN|nr:potassium channel family protein [Actinomadura barringtoniae]MBO2455130.1 two pore domain potassium channel family protein [Actinomadura barringtoniae]